MGYFVNKIKQFDDYTALGGVLLSDIKEAEEVLGVTFANEYKEYLLECGIATADGHEYTGLGKSQRLNVVVATQKEKKKNLNIEDNLYLVEDLGFDKILIWQSEKGNVYQTIEKGKPELIADSLANYIK